MENTLDKDLDLEDDSEEVDTLLAENDYKTKLAEDTQIEQGTTLINRFLILFAIISSNP